MRINTVVGDKSDHVAVMVKNNEASASIPVGSPVMLNMNATDDGIGVVLPSGSAAKAHSYFYGVVTRTIAAGERCESIVYGFCQNIVLLRQTRAASTDAFSSNSDGFLTGTLLNVDTVNNAFSTSGGTQAKSAFLPFAVLAASVASWASSASATSDTRTAITVTSKAFLRAM